MTVAAVADTHTALWYLWDDPKLSSAAGRFVDDTAAQRKHIAISSVSLAELVYLVEKKRLPRETYTDLLQAINDPEHVFVEAVFSAETVSAMWQTSREEVPDMPDRMIVATAAYFGVPVITRDRLIQESRTPTIW